MAWIAEDHRKSTVNPAGAMLTEEMKQHLSGKYFPRYPTKRAVLLPALHYVQHHLGYLPTQVIGELAEFLDITPAEAMDTASFYEEYWLKPKGKYLLSVCRSLSCGICGSQNLVEAVTAKLNIEPGQTTADGRFTLVEVECLGSCGTAPDMLVNEVLHENLTPEGLDKVLDGLPDDPAAYRDPSVTWPVEQ